MAYWTDNISNISDEELCKDDLRLDSILAKEVAIGRNVEDQLDRVSVISKGAAEVMVDLSCSRINNGSGVNIEESQAVDLSLRSRKAPCSVEEEDVTLGESSVLPNESQKEDQLLDILRLASTRVTSSQGMLCHLCDLEVYLLNFDPLLNFPCVTEV